MKKQRKKRRIFKATASVLYCVLVITLIVGCFIDEDSASLVRINQSNAAQMSELYLFNPYRDVDWDSVGHYRANLHAHTNRSDGRHTPAYVIAKYQELGYDFLAITEHNRVTYPWTDFGHIPRPQKGGLFDGLTTQAIAGNELSRGHHVVSLFTDFNAHWWRHRNARDKLTAGSAHGSGEGRFFLAHPGRYVPHPQFLDLPFWGHNLEFYVGMYLDFPSLVGMEVFNQADRYRHDRKIYDRVLSELMPHRPVWAIAADDNHGRHYGFNKVTMLLTEPTIDNFRQGLERGVFFSSSFGRFNPQKLDEQAGQAGARWDYVPSVERIDVCAQTGYINIIANNYTDIIWTTYRGREAGRGGIINYRQNSHAYRFLRATLVNEIDGELIAQTLVQPFGIGEYCSDSWWFYF